MTENALNIAKSNEPVPAYRDTFVHFLFGAPSNESILLHFLNAVLESDGQSDAKSVEIRNPFNPATFVTDKYTILDVKATDERGDIFVVEFQTSERGTFAGRMTCYVQSVDKLSNWAIQLGCHFGRWRDEKCWFLKKVPIFRENLGTDA